MDSLCDYLKIKHKLSSAYHPKTNRLTERFNRTICKTLAKYISEFEENWDIYLPSMLLVYRTKLQSTTKQEPFYLVYGRQAILPIQTNYETYSNNPNLDFQEQILRRTYELINNLPEQRRKAKINIEQSQRKQKDRYDAKITPQNYYIGDKVLLYKN